MGIVCELYRASDSLIAEIATEPEQAAEFVTENFNSVSGAFHNDDTVTYLDKGWNVAFFLLKEADRSPGKILSGWVGKAFKEKDYDTPYYLTSSQVKVMAALLTALSEEEIKSAYNFEKMEAEHVYRANRGVLQHWEAWFELIKQIIDTFKRASKANDGIIINFS